MELSRPDLLLLFVILFLSFLMPFTFVIFYRHKSYLTASNLPPGTIGLPFIGESFEFLSAGWKGQPETFIFDRIAQFSSQVFKTHITGVPMAVLCGMDGNKFLFSNENKLVVAWWPDSVNRLIPVADTENAKRTRKLILPFIKPEILQNYIGLMDDIAQRHFSSDWESKDEVLVYPLAKRYTLWLAYRLFLSIEDPNYLAKFAVSFNQVVAGFLQIPIDFPGTPFHKSVKASKLIETELLVIIKQRKMELVQGKGSKTQDILSHMLATTDEDGVFATVEEIANRILALLIAGHDTASVVCTWIVNYLAEYPIIYQRVYVEQMEIAKWKEEGGFLNWDDLKKMKYSWNVACEVMRLVPPAQGAFREAIHDFNFKGFHIPKGWKLYWSANATHKNPEYFPEPERFDPSRFEGDGPAPYTYVPFGGGPRMCPGNEYARLEILVFMHNLVKRFKWEKVIPDEKKIMNPIPYPAKGLPVRLYRHKI